MLERQKEVTQERATIRECQQCIQWLVEMVRERGLKMRLQGSVDERKQDSVLAGG